MIKNHFSHLLIVVLFIVSGIGLHAQTADVTAGCIPLRVNFTAPTDATTFFWDFKDGSTSELANPVNLFNAPGTFEVEFRASETGAVIGTITIEVADKLDLTFATEPMSGCAPLDVTFTNTTSIPDGVELLSQRWVFNDGTSVSGETIMKTFPDAGLFPVVLEINTTSESCDVTQQFPNAVEVVNGPAVQFSTSPSPAASCSAPFTVSFENQTPNDGNVTFEWDFGNGMTSTEANPPPQTYTENGDFAVTLSATDNLKGCTKTFSSVVAVGSPVPSFTIPERLCVGTPIIFENTSSEAEYVWDVVGVTSSTDVNLEITFPEAGEFQVRLIANSPGGCSDDITQTITVDIADPTFAANPNFGCSEPFAVSFTPLVNRTDVTYDWQFGDDSTSTMANVVHEYNADNESPYHENGEFIFNPTLTVSTASGCIDSSTQEIILDIPLARFMPDTVSGCAPLTVEFSDSSRSTQDIINYEYIYGDGQTANFSTPNPHNYIYSEAGEFDAQLVITNNLGCVDTSYSIRVEVGTRITPDFTTDRTEACQGEPIAFSDNTNSDLIDEWHYYTNDNRSSHCFNESSPTIPFESATGNFGVTMIVGYNGCLDSIVREDFINIKGPIAQIDYSIPCDDPLNVSFTSLSEEATTVTWDFGDGEMDTADSTSHTYAVGDFKVRLTAENAATGCPASVDSTFINVRDLVSLGMVEFSQCKDQPVSLDASMAIGVDTSCFKGYTWHFNHPSLRPLTINEPTNDEISYPDIGAYTIELVVEDINGCVDSSAYPIFVYEAVADFTMDKSTICFPMSVSFTNNSTTTADNIETYMWDFGDGVGMAETENANYTYVIDPGQGAITVNLSIEDSEGCPGETSMIIETYTPQSQITTDPALPNICAGETVNFSATDFTERGSSLNFNWDLGNGVGSDISTASSTYNEGGTFDVVLNFNEIATGCPGQASTTVNVQDFPIASFTTGVDGTDPLCHSQNVAFSNTSETTSPLSSVWNFGNGSSAVGDQAISFFEKGSFTVTLNTQTSFGCDDRTDRVFNFVGPEGDIQLNGEPFCQGDEVVANAINLEDVASFSWLFQGEVSGMDEATNTFVVEEVPPNGQAPLVLDLLGPQGCTFPVEMDVAVSQVIADFTASTDPCNSNVSFANQSIGSNSFNWDFGNGETSNSVSPLIDYGSTGDFVVLLQVENTSNGCIDEISQTISVNNPIPVIARDLDTCIVTGSSFSLPIVNNGVASLVFDQTSILDCPDGGAIGNCTTPTLNTNTDVSFTLTVNDVCFGTETFEYNIGVFNPNGTMLPNAFTPDGDGTNDFFNVILSESGCSEVTEVLDFKVFDRWGTRVYDNDTPTQGWNGLFKGERQNPDVYVYAIEVRLNDGSTTTLSGDVTLIR